MHHILGNKILEYDVDDRGVIIDEREYDTATYKKDVPAESIEVNIESTTIQPNQTFQLIVTVFPENSTDTILYSSSNENIVTVSDTGLITATSRGDAIVTVTVGSITKQIQITVDDLDYYGISFTYEQASSARTRTGITDYHKNLPIQSQMKGCTITSDGTVKYLNSTDWTKYEDGADRDYTLNTMVEIPEFWALTVVTDNNIELRLYQHEVEGAEYFPKSYCSAYEGYNDNNILKSINNGIAKPTVNVNRSTFQQYARANGSDNWNIYTYKIHKAIALLYIVEYANMNGQLAVNDQLTTEGYKQGGLGSGATEGIITISGTATYSVFTCGCTDSLGNGSGQITQQFDNTDAEGTIINTVTRKANRYRGIENPFGHVFKNTIDTIVHYNAEAGVSDVYYTEDRTKFGSTLNNYGFKCSTVIVNNWYKDLQYTPQFELFVAPGTATHNQSSSYFADYTYADSSTADRTVLIGGRLGSSATAGWFYLHSGSDLGGASASIGCRLVYLP